jgi:nitrogenase-stabilizing/protective protein
MGDHSMSDILKQLSALSAAEDFLEFFGIPYVQSVVHVNRLHILQRFNQYLRTTPGFAQLDSATQRQTCRDLLTRAYQDFVRSTPAKEKVFKVFQDIEGGHVTLASLRRTLPTQRKGA